MNNPVTVPGGHATSLLMQTGDKVQITNLEGSQVVDAWAFSQSGPNEFLSTEHTRSCLEKLIPAPGDHLYSNLCRPILTLSEDTSPGIHDLLVSACDENRYRRLGHQGYHRSCVDNLKEMMAQAGRTLHEIPSPFNIFENVKIHPDGRLSIEPPLVKKGESVVLQAQQDIILVLSACPMDIALTNGPDRRAKPIRVTPIN